MGVLIPTEKTGAAEPTPDIPEPTSEPALSEYGTGFTAGSYVYPDRKICKCF